MDWTRITKKKKRNKTIKKMIHENRYMKTLEKICCSYCNDFVPFDCMEVFYKEKNSLRFTFDKNEHIIKFPNAYFFRKLYCSNPNRYNINDFQVTIRELAEIICPVGYLICEFNDNSGIFYIQRASFRDQPLLRETTNMCCSVYISGDNYNVDVDRSYNYFPEEAEPVSFDKAQFVRYLHWSARRNAILVAYKYKNGKFFHAFKWIALFL